ncbi:4-carboxymuconolactone decarboxylase [Mycobacteroides abscessus subsp. bolletii]|uniref:carboxymuconolactone decarboxylase family protein n=1 Tax=Mycobacteroides abscessus TaxID=36809 RepID=UPI0009A8DBBB|nr:carboxymuconolactone decarboxylase family protein [Mycobacteroides abscessus]SKG70498.1 4-carboxymuconolactone decarboxylase [Mycobacteroides abscessus subsp. bolletii]SKH11958.1 4-carboxymuconolactone decarboxylase [Mycobacteroides abscessus subsp. bolletii]
MPDCPVESTGELSAEAGDFAGTGGHARGDAANACPPRSIPRDSADVVAAASEQSAACSSADYAPADSTADVQRLMTEYALGTIWAREGLDRRSRSLITVSAMIACGRHEELAMHLRAARRNGLTVAEIEELLLLAAIYCGAAQAAAAFRIAVHVLPGFGDSTREGESQ